MKKMKLLLIIPAILLGFFGAAASAESIYTQSFPGKGGLSSVGWEAITSGMHEELGDVHGDVGIVNYAFFAPHAGGEISLKRQPCLLFTAKPEIRMELNALSAVRYSYVGDPVDATYRVAIKMNGEWFAQSEGLVDARSNPGPHAPFLQASFTADDFSAATSWKKLIGSNPISLGESPEKNLSGKIEAIGLLLSSKTSGDHIRFKNFSVESTQEKEPLTILLDTLEGRLRGAADYQIAAIIPEEELHRNPRPRRTWLGDNIGGWRSATLHLGLFKLWELTKDPKYMDQMRAVGELRGFKPHPRLTAADDQCIGQTYLRLYEVHKDPKMLEPMKEAARLTMERSSDRSETRNPAILKHGGKGGNDVWSFADALFMSPPNWALLIKITGDPDGKYADYLEKIYKRNWDFLFDTSYQLYYRDTHFIGKTRNGQPVFWGRGNGWVMGSLALVLEKLPKDHELWPVYAERLRLFSEGIAKCELPGGGFGISLMNNVEFPEVELSATSLISFGMTFGLNNGILPKEKYEPIVRRAWEKVSAMQTPDGAMRQCQQGGVAPERFDPQNNEDYGTGAMLLFASEYIKWSGIDMTKKTWGTFARTVPERLDDFAWENDKIAFRAYGPKARKGAENSGIDCWLKRVDYPIIDKWYGQMNTKSYHEDWGEGHDPYHVGSSAGCGGTGIWLNGKREPLETYTKQELIECTPQRSQFKLTYEREIDGDVYGEEKTITIELGKRLFDVHSVFTKNGKIASDLPVCIGLTTHDGKAETFSDEKQGWIACWEKMAGSEVGTAAMADPTRIVAIKEVKSDTKDESHHFIFMKTDRNGAIDYQAGYGWKKAGEIKTSDDWKKYLNSK